MDIFIPIVIFFVLFVFFSLCGMCCKRRRDQGAIIATPVVITSTQHHVGPYPVHVNNTNSAAPAGVIMQHHNSGTGVYPIPPVQAMPQPMPGYNPAPGGYPPQPYPPQQQQQQPQYQQYHPSSQMPMAMPMPGTAPPSVAAQAMINPPSYDSVVTDNYAKQAPYNPHFSGQ